MMRLQILLIGLLASLALYAQQPDMAIHVSRPSNITITPGLKELHSGYTYDFVVNGLATSSLGESQASFGTVFSKISKDGKSLELKITVMGSNSSIGTLTILDIKSKVLISQQYKIVATIRYTDYTPSTSGSIKPNPVVLFLGKDTLADNGGISVGKLRIANSLLLYDGKIPPGAIRRNLMCKITLVHDTSSIVVHSALNYLSDKVKQTLQRAQPGDRLYITAMEVLWIDADRSDHIRPYGSLAYTLTVTE